VLPHRRSGLWRPLDAAAIASNNAPEQSAAPSPLRLDLSAVADVF
jgi:hypothetical protein